MLRKVLMAPFKLVAGLALLALGLLLAFFWPRYR